MGITIFNPLIRITFFKHFCGGVSLEDSTKAVKHLLDLHTLTVLDFGAEGKVKEEDFDRTLAENLNAIKYASTNPGVSVISSKVTALASIEILEKYQAGQLTDEKEKQAFARAEARVDKLCKAAFQSGVAVFIDAEETWIQDPVDALTILMIDSFNKNKVVVYNTLQLYRWDRLKFLKAMYEAAVERHFILGAKLVRGAYMDKERKRAEEMNYPSPIQPDKETCDRDYNEAVEFCISHLEQVATIIASHNEYSNLYATQLLDRQSLPHDHPHVHFSQLYGMSDNITFNLAKAGCSVSKYLPFGPIKDVIPYLMRRAQENSSVSGQTGRELSLIKKELKRRALKELIS
jgi:proline dehydrogenase